VRKLRRTLPATTGSWHWHLLGSLPELGQTILNRSTYLAQKLASVGYPLWQRQYFFKEFPIKARDAEAVQEALAHAFGGSQAY